MNNDSVPRSELERIGDALLGPHKQVAAIEVGRRAVARFGHLPPPQGFHSLWYIDFAASIARAFARPPAP